MLRPVSLFLAALAGGACIDAPASSAAPAPAACAAPTTTDGGDDGAVVDDRLPPGRLLRRAALVLRGTPPTLAELDALQAAGDDSAQRAFVRAFVDDALADPAFYEVMLGRGLEWLNIPLIAPTADAPEYGAQQQQALTRCDDTTARPGAWYKFREANPCDVADAPTASIEPWWDPGATAVLVGSAANDAATATANVNGSPATIDCAGTPAGGCGCGPHAIRCHPDFEFYTGNEDFLAFNGEGQRRQLAEEPARLFAHLAWFDLPMTELIAGHISVGTTNVQAAYVSQGIVGGRLDVYDDDSWWKTESFANDDHDPLHEDGDAQSWRAYDVSTRNPFFLAARDTKFDPRTDTRVLEGIPAAGILTSLGFLDGYPRERLRAARALETLACEQLDPPQGITFNEFKRDPAAEGSCQHCHRRIDPSAIHFKRWAKIGNAFEGFGAAYLMPGVGTKWHFEPRWRTGEYPFGSEPFSQWNRWYTPGTKLTPVTDEEAAVNDEVVFIDYLPPDQTLLGQTSDGTIGPLGFAKMIIAAGAFDRCVVRQLHKAVLGRDIDATKEAGYLDVLVKDFVAHGRTVRPLIHTLVDSDAFSRGL